MRRSRFLLFFAIFFSFVATFLLFPLHSLALPPVGFQNEVVVSGLTMPTTSIFTPDGRLLISELGGTIKIVLPGKTSIESSPFLIVPNFQEYLSSIALDPNFSTNNYFYIFFRAKDSGKLRVSRYSAQGNTANPSSEKIIWENNEVFTGNSQVTHYGGSLTFGNDGKLYITVGDGSDRNFTTAHPSQRLDSYRGKLLRINSDGSIPSDNPFADGSGPNLDAIYARGLRNPFKIHTDKQTGALYIGDVGETTSEEINIGKKGANYGWPICEGACSTSGMTNPIFVYPHSGSASVVGGFVFRGNQFPNKYIGNYFYGDFAKSFIKRLTFGENGSILKDIPFEPFDGTVFPYGTVIDLMQGYDGLIYYTDFKIGQIKRIKYLHHSLFFDGKDDFVKIGNIQKLSEFTIEAMIKRYTDTNKTEVILSDSNAEATQQMFSLAIDAGSSQCGGSDQLVYYQMKGMSKQCSGVSIEIGKWYHVAVTRHNNGVRKMFVNGEIVSSTTNTPAPSDSSGLLAIGRQGGKHSDYFSGYIDEVRISKNIRYTEKFIPQTSNFILDSQTYGVWHFDEGFGQVVHDESANKLNGIVGRNESIESPDPTWSVKTKVRGGNAFSPEVLDSDIE